MKCDAFIRSCLLVTLLCVAHQHCHAQNGYRQPPPEVVDIIDAKPSPSISLSPNREWMLLIEREAMPSIADISRRMLRLAGLRIDPASESRFLTSFSTGMKLKKLLDEDTVSIPLPEGSKISGWSWSHKSNAFVVRTVTAGGQQLWYVDLAMPESPKMLTDKLTTVLDSPTWMPDGKTLLVQLIPESRGAEPEKSLVPSGPNIQESSGNESPTRTYQDLLSNAYDEELFAYYVTSQLALVGADREPQLVGSPGIFRGSSPSPDGKHLLVTAVQRPFSYLQTLSSFPHNIEVWDLEGEREHLVASVPLAENIPIEGVRTGPRSVDWMTGFDARLSWTEALDGGDPNVEAEYRDRLVMLDAPFDNEPSELFKTEHRSFGMSAMKDPMVVVATDYDRDRRWIRSLMFDLQKQADEPKIMMDRSMRDRYGDPGQIATVADEHGHVRAIQDGDWVYRTGSGASPKGNLPFIDRQNIKTLESERLWRCEEGKYESVVAIVEHSEGMKPIVVISSETETTPTNYALLDLNSGQRKWLTDFKDPTPQIREIKKQLVKYTREDGVELSATLYLPADYKPGTRLPLLVWAYPREYNDPKTAAQVSGSPSRFTRMTGISHLTFLTQGYAIMDAATMPVVGDPETMNDTFIEQIVSSAQAAIDKAVEMGVADRNRVGVGGHSYGAFMTANLLAHCDLFKAGIARSGAYNRTLTPFGFQSERRPFWEASDIYFKISPFMHADKLDEPILLVHGEADNNSGTFPIQSKRMYQAIKGNGGTVRLVMLPNESHGYRARESVLHTQAEMIEWFDTHVKNAASSN